MHFKKLSRIPYPAANVFFRTLRFSQWFLQSWNVFSKHFTVCHPLLTLLYSDLLQLLFAHTSSAISPIEPIVCLNYSHLCFAPLRNTCGNNSTAHEVHRTLRCSLFPGMKYESRSESLFDRYGLYEVRKHCWQNLFCHRETSVQENPGTCTVRWHGRLTSHLTVYVPGFSRTEVSRWQNKFCQQCFPTSYNP